MQKGTSHIVLMAMADLLSKPLVELAGLAKTSVRQTQKAKELTENNKATIPMLGKVIAAMKKLFNQEKGLSGAMTFAQYWEMQTGEKRVNNHAESCGLCYAVYVENNLATEKDYDFCVADFLEKAASIYTAVKGDLTRPEILEAAQILKDRPKDGSKKLQAIIDKLKGPREIDGAKALEYLRLIYANGLLNTVLASASAEIRHLADPVKLDAASDHVNLMVAACRAAREAIAQPGQQKPAPQNAPAAPAPAAPAPAPEPAPAETPASWVDANFRLDGEGVDEETALHNRDLCIADVAQFQEIHGRLPGSGGEFQNWITQLGADPAQSEAEAAALESAAA